MYILQAINESAVKYRLHKKPQGFFNHLFFTNGNGIEFRDGNPVEYVKFNRTIPWMNYYEEVIPLKEMIEHFKDYHLENEIHENFKRAKESNNWYAEQGFTESVKTEDELWEKTGDELYAEFDELSEPSLDELKDIQSWYLYLKDREYFPSLHLSKGYFDMEKLNENTEINLLELAVSLLWGYGKFYDEFETEGKDYILRYELNGADLDEKYKDALHDSKLIKRELVRLTNILESKKDLGKNLYYKKGLYNEKIL